MSLIYDVNAREVLDSRGNPTVEVEIFLYFAFVYIVIEIGVKIERHGDMSLRSEFVSCGRSFANYFNSPFLDAVCNDAFQSAVAYTRCDGTANFRPLRKGMIVQIL